MVLEELKRATDEKLLTIVRDYSTRDTVTLIESNRSKNYLYGNVASP